MHDDEPIQEDLGVGLRPGQSHYRAYVGPPEDYDLVAAMTFNLLTVLGLRQHHTVLDIGCGSLRVGRLLIPYLNRANYVGLEPNEWLIQEALKREVGQDQIRIKQPEFLIADNLSPLDASRRFDFALAQSIFSHTGLDLLSEYLSTISPHLRPGGALLATFLIGDADSEGTGWLYPGVTYFREDTMASKAEAAGLRFEVLDWSHPRQTWALFATSEYDSSWIRAKSLSWNASLAEGVWGVEAQAAPNATRERNRNG